MNLYEIDNRIMECVDEETGEIVNEELLESLEMERQTKIENIACLIKNYNSDAEQLSQEIDNLQKRKKTAVNNVERLKHYLQSYLEGKKFKTAKCSVSYRKSEAVEVSDISLLPEWAIRVKDPEPNKTEIKNAIKAGTKVPGAVMVQNVSIIIK